MIPSLEGWPTKAKEAPSPHEVRMFPLDTNPVFQSLGEVIQTQYFNMLLNILGALTLLVDHLFCLTSALTELYIP